jgi:hypothetical protein
LTGSFISIGLILALVIVQSLRNMPKVFEASIAELVKDKEGLSR